MELPSHSQHHTNHLTNVEREAALRVEAPCEFP